MFASFYSIASITIGRRGLRRPYSQKEPAGRSSAASAEHSRRARPRYIAFIAAGADEVIR